jgi:glycerophosphoryl diester phosphodiesterase
MKVIELFLKSKTLIESDCEDSIFVSEHFAAVIDGVTTKSTVKFTNDTSGRACSQLLKKALDDLPLKSTANWAVEFLTSAVFSMYTGLGIEEHVQNFPSERASACIAIYSKFRNELWMVGDCQCMVDKTVYSNLKPIDSVLSDIRSLYLETEMILGKSVNELQANDSGREFIRPLLKRQQLFQNSITKNEFTYGVIDGFKVPESEIKVINLSHPKKVILATDGYPRLFDTLAQSEKYLTKVLKTDPLCFHTFKSTKGLNTGNSSFDDRAYLSIRIE